MSDALLGLLKFGQFLGLILVIGTPLCQMWILPAARVQADAGRHAAVALLARRLDRLFRRSLFLGAALVAAGALGQAVAAALPLDGVSTLQYLLQARVGRFLLARIALALALPAVVLIPDRWLQRVGAAALGVAAAFTVSAVSHAARHGDLAVLLDLFHLTAAGAWVGGLLSLAVLPWRELVGMTAEAPTLGRRLVGGAAGRFSRLGGLAVVALIVTGLYSASLHVYGVEALGGSPYGQALAGKMALFLLVLLAAFINRFWLVPELLPVRPGGGDGRLRLLSGGPPLGGGEGAPGPVQAPDPRPPRQEPTGPPTVLAAAARREQGRVTAARVGRLGRLVRWEAAAAVLILAVTGLLTVLPPVDRPAQLAEPVALALAVDGLDGTAVLEPGAAGDLEIRLAIRQPAEVRQAVVEFDMPGHAMARQRVGLVAEGDRYVGSVFITMPGVWRASWLVTARDGATLRAQTGFSVGATPGYAGSQVNIVAAFADLPRGLQAGAGMLAMGAALGLMGAAWSRHTPLPFLGGLALLTAGLLVFLNVAVIEAFPTTRLHNPVPAELGILAEARQNFARECADCHGAQGRGDSVVPPPVTDARLDLRDPLVQARTDGDLYWLITRGREERGMPGFGEALSEEERWALVHQVRALGIGALVPDEARHHLGLIGFMFVLMSVPALVVGLFLVAVQAKKSQ